MTMAWIDLTKEQRKAVAAWLDVQIAEVVPEREDLAAAHGFDLVGAIECLADHVKVSARSWSTKKGGPHG
jgi:hypothetical protein